MSEKSLNAVELELRLIQERNSRVEIDKAWEVSTFRVIVICAITYFAAGLLLAVIGAERNWLAALVPVAGFYLSAQSLPVLKRWWVRNRYQSNLNRNAPGAGKAGSVCERESSTEICR